MNRMDCTTHSTKPRVGKLQTRTVSAILVWLAIALLILNGYFKSQWIVLVGIALVVIAVITYFIPRFRK